MSRAGLILKRVLAAFAGLTVVFLMGCQMGMLSGTPPDNLGAKDGRLAPVRAEYWNAVSSQATTDYHRIDPLKASPDPAATFERMSALVAQWPGATVVDRRPGYLRAEFQTRWMKFVDDVEFLLDASGGVIHVRSASRLGRKDFGVNRQRIEAIRARLNT